MEKGGGQPPEALDVPGCVATGKTLKEKECLFRDRRLDREFR